MRYKIVYAGSYDLLAEFTIRADNINEAIQKFNDSEQLLTTIYPQDLTAYAKDVHAKISHHTMHAVIEETSPYFNFDIALRITKIFDARVYSAPVHGGTLIDTAKSMLERMS